MPGLSVEHDMQRARRAAPSVHEPARRPGVQIERAAHVHLVRPQCASPSLRNALPQTLAAPLLCSCSSSVLVVPQNEAEENAQQQEWLIASNVRVVLARMFPREQLGPNEQWEVF